MKKNTALSIIALMTFISCCLADSFITSRAAEKGHDDWKTLQGQNYTIQYPPTWELNEKELMGTSFILFSPLESEKDQFRENVNLIIQDIKGQNLNLNQYAKLSGEQIKKYFTNFILIESKGMKNDSDENRKR